MGQLTVMSKKKTETTLSLQAGSFVWKSFSIPANHPDLLEFQPVNIPIF